MKYALHPYLWSEIFPSWKQVLRTVAYLVYYSTYGLTRTLFFIPGADSSTMLEPGTVHGLEESPCLVRTDRLPKTKTSILWPESALTGLKRPVSCCKIFAPMVGGGMEIPEVDSHLQSFEHVQRAGAPVAHRGVIL